MAMLFKKILKVLYKMPMTKVFPVLNLYYLAQV
ncbi:hypothetical protein ESCOCK365M_20385 [Escherichia coli]